MKCDAPSFVCDTMTESAVVGVKLLSTESGEIIVLLALNTRVVNGFSIFFLSGHRDLSWSLAKRSSIPFMGWMNPGQWLLLQMARFDSKSKYSDEKVGLLPWQRVDMTRIAMLEENILVFVFHDIKMT